MRRAALAIAGSLVVAVVLIALPNRGGAQDAGGHDHGGSTATVGATIERSHAWHAGDAGLPHRDAAEIQERIDAASPGAVIAIEPGMYHGNLVIDRAVTLRAEGHALIVGDGTGSVILVTGDGAAIDGLHVRHSADGPVGGPAGIRIEADDVVVEGVLVEDTYMGIAVFGGRDVRLLGNAVVGREAAAIDDEAHAAEATPDTGHGHARASDGSSRATLRGDGISLWNARDAVVRGNVVEHARDGIFLSFGAYALVDGNRVVESRYAVHGMFARDLTLVENTFERNLSGAVLMYGGPVLLLRNRIEGSASTSTGFAILLKDVSGYDAVENVLVGNRIGIQIDGPGAGDAGDALIHGNTIALNRYGVSLYPSAAATFYRNSFVENTVQVVGQGPGVAEQNTWYHEGIGNYWSDYLGYDLRGEGLGDVAHHEGGSVESLLVRAPVLEALASGPAFGLLRAVEDRWVEHEPVAMDPMPLMRPASPSAGGQAVTGTGSAVLSAGGLLAVVLAAAVLVTLRRPVRRGRIRHAA